MPNIFLLTAVKQRKRIDINFDSTAHTHTMETHSMEKVPSMENFSINQTE